MDHGPVQRMLHRLLTIGDKLQVIEEVQCRVVNVIVSWPSVGLWASLRCALDILDQDLISRLGPPYQT